uniref:Uncharacterized protein n=1 Tax=Anguilla anguilla TaxID=7936 RepID=A0A0E9XSX5_ANGAN
MRVSLYRLKNSFYICVRTGIIIILLLFNWKISVDFIRSQFIFPSLH